MEDGVINLGQGRFTKAFKSLLRRRTYANHFVLSFLAGFFADGQSINKTLSDKRNASGHDGKTALNKRALGV